MTKWYPQTGVSDEATKDKGLTEVDMPQALVPRMV